MKKILIVTDNNFVGKFIFELMSIRRDVILDFAHTWHNHDVSQIKELKSTPINVKKDSHKLASSDYDLIFSAHCKQLFPAQLVKSKQCINLHPGLNPFNRGWYPQVFSIINGLPIGATLHVMDELLDHGPIIDQLEVPIYEWDNSETVYNRVLDAERSIVERNLDQIVNQSWKVLTDTAEGNLNLKADFNKLCKLEMDEKTTMRKAINKLRALTHGSHKNAYYYTNDGKKVFVALDLEVVENSLEN